MPEIPKKKQEQRKALLCITDLLDLRRLAEFMGWPFEGETATLWRWQSYRSGLFEEWSASKHNNHKEQLHDNFVRQCAREAYGIKASVSNTAQRHPWHSCPKLYSLT
jgi:hypothetical protein